MRQYRGKRKDNGEWVKGWYWCNEETKTSYIRSMNFQPNRYDYTDYEVIPATVGQSTGLADNDGVEVFEGDIVRYSSVEAQPDLGVVEYEVARYAGFSLKSVKTGNCSFMSGWGLLELVGNIHDNPELLEAKE